MQLDAESPINAEQPQPRRRTPAGRLRWLDPRLLGWLIGAGTVQATIVAGLLAGLTAHMRAAQQPPALSLLAPPLKSSCLHRARHESSRAEPGAANAKDCAAYGHSDLKQRPHLALVVLPRGLPASDRLRT
ncbi:MAG: hypothetical protein P4L83_03060 [Nevskia sp.]|nr:hypothetical protein [Nevskia sp.]